MTPRGRRTRSKPKLILIFGEDENDTKTVREFILALRPDLGITIEARRNPPINLRDAPSGAVRSRAERIARVIDAASVDSDVVAVFAHEDTDAVEPSHVALSAKIETAFRSIGYQQVWAAIPAWEMEAWLMQWPEAFAEYLPSWRRLRTAGRRVGLIDNAKEYAIRELRPGSGRVRDYRESDSPYLANIVRSRSWSRSPRAVSHSFDLFVEKVDALTV